MLYLASQSPRRSQLLAQIGQAHQLLLPDAAEDTEALEAVLPYETPSAYVQRVTGLKLLAAVQRWHQRQLPPAPVLCADTTVALHGRILGKPADADEAQAMLTALSGQHHQVLTAIALAPHPQQVLEQGLAAARTALQVSDVEFDVLDAQRIAAYIDTGEPFGKAGSYGIQGHAAVFVRQISGSYSGIMGLPLFELGQLMSDIF